MELELVELELLPNSVSYLCLSSYLATYLPINYLPIYLSKFFGIMILKRKPGFSMTRIFLSTVICHYLLPRMVYYMESLLTSPPT